MWIKEEEFCYPSDFYWFKLDKNRVLEWYKINKLKTVLVLIFSLCFATFIIPTFCMILYYLTYPFKWINNKCKNWCYW